MGIEIERQWIAPDDVELPERIGPFQAGEGEQRTIVDSYLDTAERALRDAGGRLRTRVQNGRRLATFKRSLEGAVDEAVAQAFDVRAGGAGCRLDAHRRMPVAELGDDLAGERDSAVGEVGDTQAAGDSIRLVLELAQRSILDPEQALRMGRSTAPAAVSCTSLAFRSRSCTPSSFSSAWMRRVRPGWVRLSRPAARPKWPSVATATNAFS
jgi:hypothetical protein